MPVTGWQWLVFVLALLGLVVLIGLAIEEDLYYRRRDDEDKDDPPDEA